jgi:two-component system cell cycle response regulator
MSSMVTAALSLRRTVRASAVLIASLALGCVVWLGAFQGGTGSMGLEHAAASVLWLALFAQRASLRSQAIETEGRGVRLDLELGLLLLIASHALVQLMGGLEGPLYPLVYVVVAFLASFARKPMGHGLVLVALLFEAPIWFMTEDHASARPFVLHAVFIVFFGALNLMFTRVEIARVRERSIKALDEDKAKVREESRMFRLVAPASGRAHDEERLFQSSVEEVHHALYHVLHLLHRSLDLHTCVLLMLDERGEQLRIVELVTNADEIAEGPFAAGEGALGAVVRRQITTNLEHIRPNYKGLPYYADGAPIQAFIGVPVREGDQVRGVLCGDRLADRPFSAREEEVFESAIRQVLRALENERVFVQLERGKREQSILFSASQMLGAALNEAAVIDAGLEASQQIAPYEFAAITLYDADSRRHTVRKAVGVHADEFQNLTFRDNNSLTAMAVKNHHYLPYRGDFDPRQQTVYTRRENLRGMDSLLILPLIVREDAIGTLALAARRRDAFGDAVRPALQVLANQLAVSLSNAKAVARLEEMATTDGLTGCLNKRAFLDELDRRVRSAERFGRKLSLIVTDIDHFKSVNDTYGHATGDVVIRELGQILMRVKRETDLVARFGGEEFCVLCEETDTDGAILLAERVREELGETVFQTENGKLQVRASLGVATFPTHAKTPEGLFDITDKALYAAKHGGRNMVVAA